MRIACPGCQAEFNIDDSRIPAGGLHLKCPKCAALFAVKKDAAARPPPPAVAPGPVPLPAFPPGMAPAAPPPGAGTPPAIPPPFGESLVATKLLAIIPDEALT
jgi:predicted Zn finger-like uncharacterized protein